ncbi:MAG TPA: permease [Rectinemataceae bacterium]|nr:permease [Rectinemataceae bacterium]
MSIRQAAPSRSGDIRIAVLYPVLAIALLFVLVKYVVIPHSFAFLDRLSITILAITVEALPFLLIGSLLSAAIHLYVSERTIARIIPRNSILGVLAASLLGLALPVCDCATVPIVRRLVAKGVPLHVAVTFMLAVPMINPLVIFSTWFAFYQFPDYIFYRIGFGLASAIVVGFIVSFLDRDSQIKLIERWQEGSGHEHHDHDHDHQGRRRGLIGHVTAVAEHAAEDFFDMGRYFVVGVVLSAIVQSTVPRDSLYALGHNPLLALVVMVAAAYLLSVCSQADAFIARAFMNQFSQGAIIAFLIFGPMIDLKNTLMLSVAFKARFILILIGLIACVSILSGYLVNLRIL